MLGPPKLQGTPRDPWNNLSDLSQWTSETHLQRRDPVRSPGGSKAPAAPNGCLGQPAILSSHPFYRGSQKKWKHIETINLCLAMSDHVWPSLAMFGLRNWPTIRSCERCCWGWDLGMREMGRPTGDPQQNSAMIHGSMTSVRTFLEIAFPVSEVCLKNKKGRKGKTNSRKINMYIYIYYSIL